MSTGLPVSRLIRASVSLTALAAQYANVNSLLILGDSDIIDTQTRIVSYADIASVAAAFGTSAPEYLAASLFFSQAPKPTQLYIGKWAQAATAGRLIGAPLTAAQQVLANFTAITTGALKLQIDGASAVTISALNFSAAINLNGVASILNSALTGATCVWDGSHFVIKSSTTGATSAISYPVAPAAGVDIKALFGFVQASGARSVGGIIAETAVAAVTLIDQMPTFWEGLMFASTNIVNADHLAVAAYIEATAHIYGLTTQEATAIDAVSTADIGYQLKALGYQRTFGQYSASSPYAVASMFGRILTTDFNANNSTITLQFKQEPGVTAETLTSAQANALDGKRYNYFANFNNGTAIIVNGMMFGPAYVDEIYGLDWLVNRVQTDLWNLLYTSATKIPQTDDGVNQLLNTVDAACGAAVNNGLLAPGTWQAGGFGQIKTGDFLPKGYYVYAPAIATQSAADRAARKSPPIQIAAKLAGAVHSADVAITVNR